MRVILVLVGFSVFLGMQYAMAHHGPETIEINTVQKVMPPVTFQHYLHQDRTNGSCTGCHHKGTEGDPMQQPCSSCHGKLEDSPGYKDAMHNKCQGCHKEKVAEGLKAPTMCPACHVKK